MIETTHTILGFLSLFTGLYILLNRKGTKTHKLIGRIYVGSMFALNTTAFGIYELFGGFGIFHWAAIVSLFSIVGGMVVIMYRKNLKDWITTHYYFMVWSYIGLLAATSNEAFVHIPFLTQQAHSYSWLPMASMLSVFIVGGTWVEISRQRITQPFYA